MPLFEIMVPCQWNTGRPVRTRHHKEWDKRVRKISGGLTILKPVKGQWVHEGYLYEDRVIPVRVLCTHEQIMEIVDITIEHYEQEAVMVYMIADWTLVKTCTDEQRANFIHKRNTIAGEVTDA